MSTFVSKSLSRLCTFHPCTSPSIHSIFAVENVCVWCVQCIHCEYLNFSACLVLFLCSSVSCIWNFKTRHSARCNPLLFYYNLIYSKICVELKMSFAHGMACWAWSVHSCAAVVISASYGMLILHQTNKCPTSCDPCMMWDMNHSNPKVLFTFQFGSRIITVLREQDLRKSPVSIAS